MLSETSKSRLATCVPELQEVFTAVSRFFPFTITCGHRDKQAQDKAFAEGKSEKKWPNGDHNPMPSKAVDAYPSPIDYEDTERMKYFAGFVVGTGAILGYRIQWGNDWDMDTELKDEKFHDYGHFAYKGKLEAAVNIVRNIENGFSMEGTI